MKSSLLSPWRVLVVLPLCLLSWTIWGGLIVKDPFQRSVEAILKEEGIRFTECRCKGGWLGVDGVRMVQCEVSLPGQDGVKLSHLGRVTRSRRSAAQTSGNTIVID